MNTATKALLCLLAMPVFVFAYGYLYTTGGTAGPSVDTSQTQLSGSSGTGGIDYGSTGGDMGNTSGDSSTDSVSSRINTTLNPPDNAINGSSGYGGTDLDYIYYEMYKHVVYESEKTNRLLYKITGFMSLLLIMNCMLFYYIYQTSVAINTDKKFKSEQRILLTACIATVIIFSIYVCVR